MTIDDYLAGIERGLRQNVHIGRIEEPLACLSSTGRTLVVITTGLAPVSRR